MYSYGTFGRRLRLRRLNRTTDQRLFVVPLDHSITIGPVAPSGGLNGLVRTVAGHGADAIVLHKGTLRQVDHAVFTDTALIVHLNASTVHASDPDAKYLVASVEEAVSAGADAVSVHVNIGSPAESQQVADLAAVARDCDRWSVPLLAMMYPRGPQVDPGNADLIVHAATVATDLGADFVKLPLPARTDEVADVVARCPVPALFAGGARREDGGGVVSSVRTVMRAGAAGVAIGRNIFQSTDVAATTRSVASAVHEDADTTPHLDRLAMEPVGS
ncbi:2-amino-3,7-dideoxy-D-threo-hept-6-ulosonate synthase [Saccharomonospora saliphila]|uniref:2-amino-3,7-dideoxy-D-threo-hept-6-ulosonate synthase n=1 Tax=Saccharomonospora saliphila TaxID=369829 RepID=UPI000366C38D|nr:2-amino-3,7-dideoxy-D-threo-hept-6-ulosonate synthase [Saccharomonospora saliphila]